MTPNQTKATPDEAGEGVAAAKLDAPELATAAGLHALGVEHTQRGDYARAVELLGKAVAMRPSVPALHVDLAQETGT